MIRLLLEECKCALDQYESDDRVVSVSVATGKLAAPYIEQIAGWVMEKFQMLPFMFIRLLITFSVKK